jgi:uncharacterized Rossmann fold enzyme
MNLVIWFSWYKEILDEFGFSRDDDEKSALILNNLLESLNSLSPIDIPIKDEVIVFGAGPSLKENIRDLKNYNLSNFTLIAADGATTALLEEELTPDIIVTDLDGKMEDIIQANQDGSFLVVHAHGNNSDKIAEYVPRLKRVLGTTQSTPMGNVYNFGGFTDGDRALYLAVELGVKIIILAGMDFGGVVTKYSRPDMDAVEGMADEIKLLKLKYAKRLVEWLASNEDVIIFNISHGEKLDGVEDVNIDELMDL